MQFITPEAKGKNIVPAVTFKGTQKTQSHHAAIQSILELKNKVPLKEFDQKLHIQKFNQHKKQVLAIMIVDFRKARECCSNTPSIQS